MFGLTNDGVILARLANQKFTLSQFPYKTFENAQVIS